MIKRMRWLLPVLLLGAVLALGAVTRAEMAHTVMLPLVVGPPAQPRAGVPDSPLPTPEPPPNLLPSPSFHTMNGWRFEGQGTVAKRHEDRWGHDDAYSAAIFTANNDAAGQWSPKARLPIQPGAHYWFGGWAYVQSYNGGGAVFELRFYDSQGVQLGTVATDSAPDCAAWVYLEAWAIAPDGATHAAFVFRSAQNIGGVWADEVFLIEVGQ